MCSCSKRTENVLAKNCLTINLLSSLVYNDIKQPYLHWLVFLFKEKEPTSII